ncbi:MULTISPECIES: GHKL domain-containing protein [Collinsella]|uniref:GHKL domain-containing protein n=1 Tax=Collinsella TaxID=102106 RepID=UPI000B380AD0|nr:MULTISPECIES: GHKL domain-containing protein [Collinsella]MBM6908299.1 sensor histidine kinase [Collinsella intestinalis]OUO64081.1 hypothetical protein B5F70_06955 [Collinsella sp. An268]
MNIVYALGAVSFGALAVSTVYLWWLLRELPLARRAVNLLMPASQILFVASAFLLRPHFAAWEAVALLAAAMGVVCACLNPLFFRSLLDAERAGIEAERAALLEDQVAAQEHYALLMRRTQAEGDRVRTELDAQLAQVEAALATGDDAAALTHLAGAAEVVRTPDDRFCEHPVVDALLAAKAAWCAEEGVELDADATVPGDLATPDVELCALFANALDNAVHACTALPTGKRWIRLYAHPAQGYFLLEVENPVAAPDTSGREGAGRETDAARHGTGALPRHGLGLAIMRQIVERRDGDLACTRENGVFTLSALWKD